jgi:hypothetical protein
MVPPPGFGSAVNWPPCASIIEREIDSPNPMPSCLLGGSIVAALISMPDADFVFIALPGEGNQLISELARNKLTPESLKHVRTMLQRKSALLGSGQEFVFGDASGGGGLHVATAPIGFGGNATLAAGCFRDTFPTRTETLLLNIAANQAAIAFQQWLETPRNQIADATSQLVGVCRPLRPRHYLRPELGSRGLDELDTYLAVLATPNWLSSHGDGVCAKNRLLPEARFEGEHVMLVRSAMRWFSRPLRCRFSFGNADTGRRSPAGRSLKRYRSGFRRFRRRCLRSFHCLAGAGHWPGLFGFDA